MRIAAMVAHKIPPLIPLDVNHFQRYETRGIIVNGKPLTIIHSGDIQTDDVCPSYLFVSSIRD